MDLKIDCLTGGINNKKMSNIELLHLFPLSVLVDRTGFTDFLLKMWTPHKTEALSIKTMSKLILVVTCVLMSI